MPPIRAVFVFLDFCCIVYTMRVTLKGLRVVQDACHKRFKKI